MNITTKENYNEDTMKCQLQESYDGELCLLAEKDNRKYKILSLTREGTFLRHRYVASNFGFQVDDYGRIIEEPELRNRVVEQPERLVLPCASTDDDECSFDLEGRDARRIILSTVEDGTRQYIYLNKKSMKDLAAWLNSAIAYLERND